MIGSGFAPIVSRRFGAARTLGSTRSLEDTRALSTVVDGWASTDGAGLGEGAAGGGGAGGAGIAAFGAAGGGGSVDGCRPDVVDADVEGDGPRRLTVEGEAVDLDLRFVIASLSDVTTSRVVATIAAARIRILARTGHEASSPRSLGLGTGGRTTRGSLQDACPLRHHASVRDRSMDGSWTTQHWTGESSSDRPAREFSDCKDGSRPRDFSP